MNLAVIILNYNDCDTTISLVNSIEKFQSIDKIVIVDNKSTDNSYEKLEKLRCDKVDVIKTNINRGYSSGNNYGIRYAINKYHITNILISNPDVVFEEKNITAMLNCLNSRDDIAMVGCTMVRPKFEKNSPGWHLPTYKSEVLTSLVVANHLFEDKLIRYEKGYFDQEISYVDIVQGCFFMIKTKCFEDVGLFDEDIFLFCEEQILGYKLKKKGYKAVILNSYSFIHNEGGSISKNVNNKINKYMLHQKSKRLFLQKYLKVSKFKLVIFDFVSTIGRVERVIIYNLRKLLN